MFSTTGRRGNPGRTKPFRILRRPIIRVAVVATLITSTALAQASGFQAPPQPTPLGPSDNVPVIGKLDLAGNVFLAGEARFDKNYDAYLEKYNAAGELAWRQRFGDTGYDLVVGLDPVGTNVYSAGFTNGLVIGDASFGDEDAFVAKYDTNGRQLWIRQFSTEADDEALAVTADAKGNVYVAGRTSGVLNGINAGESDAFVSKFNAAGLLQWTRQFGSKEGDDDASIGLDNTGNLLVAGGVTGALPGIIETGPNDVYVRKFDTEGTALWTVRVGTAGGAQVTSLQTETESAST